MGAFDDLPVVRSPQQGGAAPPQQRGSGAFDDLPVVRAPAGGATPTWGQWVRDLFTGERRTGHPQAEEFGAVVQRGVMERGQRELAAGAALPSSGGNELTALSTSAVTPDPEAQFDILRRRIPDLERQNDQHGNIMLRAPSLGVNQWTYLNRPGMSRRDLDELYTQTVATLPFGSAVGLGGTLATRAVIGAGALGGASVAQDVAATRAGSEQGIDPTRAAVSAGLGTVAGPIAGALAARAARAPTPLAAQRAADITEDIGAHQRLGVRPFAPAFSSGPVASVAKQLTDTPIIGSPARRALEESISETARAAENIAGRFGAASTADEAGLVAREGLERFRDARPADVVQRTAQGYTPAQRDAIIAAPVRDTSLKTKQAALYERAWAGIPEEMRQGGATQGLPRVLGGTPNTRRVLDDIAARNTRMVNAQSGAVEAGTGRTLPGGFLGNVIGALRDGHWRAALQTMRDIRSDFRRLQSGMAQTEGSVLRHSDIDRVESAITQDMIALLERNVDRYAQAGQQQVAANIRRAITDFRRADTFTRLASQRMETIEKLFNADSATALYRNIGQAALNGTKGDVSKLRVLARTLQRNEMDEIAAYTLREMGRPVPSARGYVQEIGFSPASFMTRLNNMAPEARELIFGRAHAQALNDLGRVVNRLANVEALANTSRSGTNALNLGGALASGGALFSGNLEAALAPLAAGGALSVLFSRPAYVRWVQGYAMLKAAARQAPQQMGPTLTAHTARLAGMASADPRLTPVLRSLIAAHPEHYPERRDPREAK